MKYNLFNRVLHYKQLLKNPKYNPKTIINNRLHNNPIDKRYTSAFPLFTEGNKITIYHSGNDFYTTAIDCITKAKERVWIEAYIFEPDIVGTLIINAIKTASLQGVNVLFIYDTIGSSNLNDSVLHELIEAGAYVYPFRKLFLNTPAYLYFQKMKDNFYRNHRKIIIADNVAFTGGMNISTDYCNIYSPSNYLDIHSKLKGPVVQELAYSVLQTAALLGELPQNQLDNLISVQYYISLYNPAVHCSPENMHSKLRGDFIQVLESSTRSHRQQIQFSLESAINSSTTRCYFTTPYFLPPPRLEKAIIRAAKRGVDVRVLIAGKTDVIGIKHASSFVLDKYIDSGVKIYQMHRKELHAKNILIDGEIVYLGSYNLDSLSYKYNMELILNIKAEGLAPKLERHFFTNIRTAMPITKKYLHSQPWIFRIYQYFFYTIALKIWE